MTRNPVSGVFLRDSDAAAALGSSELLEIVSDWASGKATFPKRRALSRELMIGEGWQMAHQVQLDKIIRAYHAMAAT